MPTFGFTGELHDTELELVHLRARWYNPAQARLLTRDSFLGMSAFPETLHPYAYVGNQLRILRQTARILLQQAAAVGGEVHLPFGSHNSLIDTRANIARCKTELRGQDIEVDDQPEDTATWELGVPALDLAAA